MCSLSTVKHSHNLRHNCLKPYYYNVKNNHYIIRENFYHYQHLDNQQQTLKFAAKIPIQWNQLVTGTMCKWLKWFLNRKHRRDSVEMVAIFISLCCFHVLPFRFYRRLNLLAFLIEDILYRNLEYREKVSVSVDSTKKVNGQILRHKRCLLTVLKAECLVELYKNENSSNAKWLDGRQDVRGNRG